MRAHPTAIISNKAKLADDLEVGPYTIIGDNVEIGSGTKIASSAVIDGFATIGKDCRVFTGACIGVIPQDLKYKGDRSYLKIGNENIIREYVTINPGTNKDSVTKIGDKNLLMAYVHIAHDCIIGNDTIIANSGTLAGYVTVEDKAVIGGLVAIHQFVRIGTYAIVGGCSKVVQDIVPYSMSDGHPTKIYGLNTTGLMRASFSSETMYQLKKAFKIIFKSGLSIPHALQKIEAELPPSDEMTYLVEFIKNSKRGICR